MNKSAFKVGDIVHLKSGRKLMRIESIDGEKMTCKWIEGKKVKYSQFDADTLVIWVRRAFRIKFAPY